MRRKRWVDKIIDDADGVCCWAKKMMMTWGNDLYVVRPKVVTMVRSYGLLNKNEKSSDDTEFKIRCDLDTQIDSMQNNDNPHCSGKDDSVVRKKIWAKGIVLSWEH